MLLRPLPLAAFLAVTSSSLGAVSADPPKKAFTVAVDAPEARVGQAAQFRLRVVVVPDSKMHVNLEYPTGATVVSPAGVEGPTGKLKPAQIDKSSARFDVAYKAREAGAKQFAGTVSFALCNDDNTQCVPHREKVQVTVSVK